MIELLLIISLTFSGSIILYFSAKWAGKNKAIEYLIKELQDTLADRPLKQDPFGVELHQAWRYHCNECDREIYIDPILYFPETEEEAELFAQEFGYPVEVVKQKGVKAAPITVVCPHCKTSHEVGGYT